VFKEILNLFRFAEQGTLSVVKQGLCVLQKSLLMVAESLELSGTLA